MARREKNPSSIALNECFSAGDDAFLTELRRFGAPKYLASIADKWKTDPRPWAREMIRTYLEAPLGDPGHQPLVKRLFKHAEATRDHEMMGWFMVAFDRMVRRRRAKRYNYDPRSGRVDWYEALRAKPNEAPRSEAPGQRWPGHMLYSHRTRYYLRRRVWRYFRFLSYREPAAYRCAIADTLLQYRDADFAKGEHIIDNWSLMHACYFESPVIRFGPSLVSLVKGNSLADLAAAPYQPQVWRAAEAFEILFDIIARAQSSLVRQWAMELVQRDHQDAVRRLELPAIMPLMAHADPRVQEFAALLFGELSGLGMLGIETWLELLETDNLSLQTLLCDAMAKHVAPERLDKNQLIELANKAATPVSRLGFELLKKRHEASPYTPVELAELADARCQVSAGEITTWVFAQIGDEAHYDGDFVVRFFDSLQESARAAGLAWLVKGSPGWSDPALWVKLIETPFADVKDVLIDRLETRVKFPGGDADQLAPLWTAVILGVHRGGRRKPKAVQQIVDAIRRKPERAQRLAPVLAFAVRSIRRPERRAGLAAIATLAEACPQLHADLATLIPELQLPTPLLLGDAS